MEDYHSAFALLVLMPDISHTFSYKSGRYVKKWTASSYKLPTHRFFWYQNSQLENCWGSMKKSQSGCLLVWKIGVNIGELYSFLHSLLFVVLVFRYRGRFLIALIAWVLCYKCGVSRVPCFLALLWAWSRNVRVLRGYGSCKSRINIKQTS